MPQTFDEKKLLSIVQLHLEKILDFDPYRKYAGVENREDFLALMAADPAFCNFGLDDPRYVIGRMAGNLVTSLHRKIGDLYENLFKAIIAERFLLEPGQLDYSVSLTIGGRLQKRSTDGLVLHKQLGDVSLPRINPEGSFGIAFEVRSCYQIGDSKRIQADYDMALALEQKNLTPVMLIFCNTSLRSPVGRLAKSWTLFEGMDAFDFVRALTSFDLFSFLQAHKDEFKHFFDEVFSRL